MLATVDPTAPASILSSLAQAGGAASGPAQFLQFLPYIAIFAVFYFMLIRPQQKKQRELEEWLKSLKKGDEVVTAGGLIGKINQLTDGVVTLELQDKIKVRVLRSHITGRPPGTSGTGPAAPDAPPADTQPKA